ncbi:NADH-quinone oxidoreductase subunit C [Reichenbachiella carrageenanivorans]|uniref:NADH-quinone oxidoreductase subunit C n=1 Tax=Reichenbachiella carrageenanivorans TaxID=2979869 RepID=A0ABY6D4P7_9BACT|nr:NADH-quinone oxidoreductase subunit C [Reichenbachiella carrageenanivorans]UXX81134.1 NADH-quinone oxidoreductase subunit C [Reichenbachiella carrageenanivorans]
MTTEDFKHLIDLNLGEGTVLSIDENATPKAVVIAPTQIVAVCELLKDNDQTYFDLLSCLTAIDNGPEVNTMEVIYNLYSIPLEHSLMIKTVLDRASPAIDTVSHLWKTADWHEREAFDLFGISFNSHPDLRRILMPADWEGYPMRKDYEEPATYRGMKTIREEEDPS